MEFPLALLSFTFCLLRTVSSATDLELTGTWATKSNSTFTGIEFYNPITDRLIEPKHTGIAYSFTDDGHYEVAYYRAISNPVTPQCPKAILQWQHGNFTTWPNGSLILTPIASDGRQALCDPCKNDYLVYTRFNQSELFDRYEVLIDPYHNIPRLNLYRFDGLPLPALYLAFKPPAMLPTTTLHPAVAATNVPSHVLRAKRGDGAATSFHRTLAYGVRMEWSGAWATKNVWWLSGLAFMFVGSIVYFGV